MNEMADERLIECLDLLEQGQSIEAILARYPDDTAVLRPFLEAAAGLSQVALRPPVVAQQASRRAFLSEAAALRETATTPSWRFWLGRFALPAASLAVVVFFLAFTLVNVSASAVPGDALYGLKRSVEEVRLSLASEDARLAIIEDLQVERLREIDALLLAGRAAEVAFDGALERTGLERWIVAGREVTLAADTIVVGRPAVGDRVRVEGRTVDGDLIASRIMQLAGTLPPPVIPLEPTLPATEDPQPEMERLPEEGEEGFQPPSTGTRPATEPTPTVTATATPTAIAPTAVPTATPAAPSVPVVTATPDVDDNDNGGGDNDDNDNGGGDNGGGDNDDNGNDGNGNDGNDNDGNDNDGNDNDGGGNDDNGNDDNGNDDNDNDGNNNDGGGDNDGNDNGGNDNGGDDNESGGENDNGGNDNGGDDNESGGENDNDDEGGDDSGNENDGDNGGDDNESGD